LRPLFADALASRGAVWMRKKDYARAQADLHQSLSLQQSVLTYFARGQLFEAQGKLDQAVADLRKAIELKPNNIFEITAQTVAKGRLEALARNNSCGKDDQRCL
jgi:tetratricopeptide (TPR) repeat protein